VFVIAIPYAKVKLFHHRKCRIVNVLEHRCHNNVRISIILVGVYTKGPWVVGGLVNNMWSFAGDEDRKDVNKMLIQPFINYNLPKGWYISVSPIITADWENEDNGWTVPVGAGIGRVFKLGKQPLNVSLHAYYNAIKPEIGGEELMGDWTIRTQVQFLIPTAKK